MDVDHQVPARRRQREGLVAAGEVAQGDGAAHVQGLVAAGLGEPGGPGTQRVFEVEGVGQVEDRLDPLAVDVDVAGLRDGDLVGVEPGQGLGDQAVDLGEGDRRDRLSQPGVHEGGAVDGEGHGGISDPAGLPHRQPA